MKEKIKEEDVIKMGFFKYQKFLTFYIYDLEDGKHLSLSNLGTPNEFLLFVTEKILKGLRMLYVSIIMINTDI